MPMPIKGGTHKTAINTPNASNTTINTNKNGNATRRNNNSYIFFGFSIFSFITQSPLLTCTPRRCRFLRVSYHPLLFKSQNHIVESIDKFGGCGCIITTIKDYPSLKPPISVNL